MPSEMCVIFAYVISQKGSKLQGKNMQNNVEPIDSWNSLQKVHFFGHFDDF